MPLVISGTVPAVELGGKGAFLEHPASYETHSKAQCARHVLGGFSRTSGRETNGGIHRVLPFLPAWLLGLARTHFLVQSENTNIVLMPNMSKMDHKHISVTRVVLLENA